MRIPKAFKPHFHLSKGKWRVYWMAWSGPFRPVSWLEHKTWGYPNFKTAWSSYVAHLGSIAAGKAFVQIPERPDDYYKRP